MVAVYIRRLCRIIKNLGATAPVLFGCGAPALKHASSVYVSMPDVDLSHRMHVGKSWTARWRPVTQLGVSDSEKHGRPVPSC